mmetsp:Transcript_13649/g.19676  ORF Transcript_13649/g.19676 Transcript_13649/m.19676 type:complete len:89 (+) Transcript_13649:210-476(+)
MAKSALLNTAPYESRLNNDLDSQARSWVVCVLFLESFRLCCLYLNFSLCLDHPILLDGVTYQLLDGDPSSGRFLHRLRSCLSRPGGGD